MHHKLAVIYHNLLRPQFGIWSIIDLLESSLVLNVAVGLSVDVVCMNVVRDKDRNHDLDVAQPGSEQQRTPVGKLTQCECQVSHALLKRSYLNLSITLKNISRWVAVTQSCEGILVKGYLSLIYPHCPDKSLPCVSLPWRYSPVNYPPELCLMFFCANCNLRRIVGDMEAVASASMSSEFI